MNENDRNGLRETVVGDLKQACLDLSAASIELFDHFEQHGLEAAWEGDGVLVVMRMQKAHEALRSFLERQAVRRMVALGIPLDSMTRAKP